jgi:hypothetical protein
MWLPRQSTVLTHWCRDLPCVEHVLPDLVLADAPQEMESVAMDYRRQAMARTREVRQCEATAAQATMALHHAEQVRGMVHFAAMCQSLRIRPCAC